MSQPSNVAPVLLTDTINEFRLRTNEVIANTNQVYDDLGDVSSLQTDARDVAGALNELDSNIGDISELTTGQTNLVDAFNEIVTATIGEINLDSANNRFAGNVTVRGWLSTNGNLTCNSSVTVYSNTRCNEDFTAANGVHMYGDIWIGGDTDIVGHDLTVGKELLVWGNSVFTTNVTAMAEVKGSRMSAFIQDASDLVVAGGTEVTALSFLTARRGSLSSLSVIYDIDDAPTGSPVASVVVYANSTQLVSIAEGLTPQVGDNQVRGPVTFDRGDYVFKAADIISVKAKNTEGGTSFTTKNRRIELAYYYDE